MSQKIIRRYSELIKIPTFEERYSYLRLGGVVGRETFGFDRYINQMFYRSQEWRSVRDWVIVRDDACDLAIPGRDIVENILIHHMNPINIGDIVNATEYLMDPDFLICTTKRTHNAIHYGDKSNLLRDPIIRSINDTCPWKKLC